MIDPESRKGIDLRADFPRNAIESDPFLIRCLIPRDVVGETRWKAAVYDFAPMEDDAGVSFCYYASVSSLSPYGKRHLPLLSKHPGTWLPGLIAIKGHERNFFMSIR